MESSKHTMTNESQKPHSERSQTPKSTHFKIILVQKPRRVYNLMTAGQWVLGDGDFWGVIETLLMVVVI